MPPPVPQTDLSANPYERVPATPPNQGAILGPMELAFASTMRSLGKEQFASTGRLDAPLGLQSVLGVAATGKLTGGGVRRGVMGGMGMFFYTGNPYLALGGAVLSGRGGLARYKNFRESPFIQMFTDTGMYKPVKTPWKAKFQLSSNEILEQHNAMTRTILRQPVELARSEQMRFQIAGLTRRKDVLQVGAKLKSAYQEAGVKGWFDDIERLMSKDYRSKYQFLRGGGRRALLNPPWARPSNLPALYNQEFARWQKMGATAQTRVLLEGMSPADIIKSGGTVNLGRAPGVVELGAGPRGDLIRMRGGRGAGLPVPRTTLPDVVAGVPDLYRRNDYNVLFNQALRKTAEANQAVFKDITRGAYQQEASAYFRYKSKWRFRTIGTSRATSMYRDLGSMDTVRRYARRYKLNMANALENVTSARMKNVLGMMDVGDLSKLAESMGITWDAKNIPLMRKMVRDTTMNRSNVLGGAVKFGKLASGLMIAGVAKDISVMLMQGGIGLVRSMNKTIDSMTRMEFGGGIVTTTEAATERQRALRALSTSTLNARQFIGAEANLLHN